MNYDNLSLILFLVMIPIIEIIIIYYAIKKFQRYRILTNTKLSKISSIKKGFYAIKGKITSIIDDLISPYSETKCVYYKFRVEEEYRDRKGSHWDQIINDEQFKKFELSDSSNSCIIDLKDAELYLKTDTKKESNFLEKASSQMIKALAKYNKSKDGWIFEKRLQYSEVVLVKGDQLYILGECQAFENNQPIFKKNHKPMMVFDQPYDHIVQKFKLYLFGYALAIVALPVIEAYLLLNNI